MQPLAHADPGVLGQRQLSDVSVPAGQLEPFGLLLEVVEQGEHGLFPAHAQSIALIPENANRLWTNV